MESRITIVRNVSGEAFDQIIKGSLTFNPRSQFLTIYPKEAYDKYKLLILLNDDSGGLAISEDGDITSIFKNYTSKERVNNIIGLLLPIALLNGGNRMDCYGEFLTRKYMMNGFVPVAKCPFDQNYAPKDWDYARDGEQDIYFLCRYTTNLDKLVHETSTVDAASLTRIKEHLPCFSYEDAFKFQKQALTFLNEHDLSYSALIKCLEEEVFYDLVMQDKKRSY